MKDIFSLLKQADTSPIYLDEIYVMNYLLSLARQANPSSDHPLLTEYHLHPKEAFSRLLHSVEVSNLANLLHCSKETVFTRLRELIDEWDGVRLQEHLRNEDDETVDLIEADAASLLLDLRSHQVASFFIGCQPEAVLGYLFNSLQIYQDIVFVAPGFKLSNNDVYKQLRFLANDANIRGKIKTNLDRRYWWEVLEKWVRSSVRAELASNLTHTTGKEISKARVLSELFKLVKMELRRTNQKIVPRTNSFRSISSTKPLPVTSNAFWNRLKEVSAEDTSRITLDALEESNLKNNKPEINAEEALRIAREFIKASVQPVDRELAHVDVFGMIALQHRFQGIVDELLSDALHYASLDNTQTPLGYFQDLIRFYCHGEYRIALSNLLNVDYLSLEQMGLKYSIITSISSVSSEASFLVFSQEDNPRLSLVNLFEQRNTPPRPPRTVKPGELLVAVQDTGRCLEVLCLYDLTQQQINELKTNLPKNLISLPSGSSIADRLLKVPLPVSIDRKRINTALQAQIEDITRCFVLSEATPDLGYDISSLKVFRKLPQPINSTEMLVQSRDIGSLQEDIQSSYLARNIKTHLLSGS